MFAEAHMGVLREYAMAVAWHIKYQISTRTKDPPLRWAVNPFTYGLIKYYMLSYPIDWVIDNSLDNFQTQEIIHRYE